MQCYQGFQPIFYPIFEKCGKQEEIQELALWLREFIWDLYPTGNELIYDNYNAVAVGWSTTDKIKDIFCSFAVYSNKDIHLGFYWGNKLTDPEKRLLGDGKQYRYIRLADKKDLPKTYAKMLMKEAHKNSLAGLKDGKQVLKGATITKSISAKKKRLK
jgi:hypothetical protein